MIPFSYPFQKQEKLEALLTQKPETLNPAVYHFFTLHEVEDAADIRRSELGELAEIAPSCRNADELLERVKPLTILHALGMRITKGSVKTSVMLPTRTELVASAVSLHPAHEKDTRVKPENCMTVCGRALCKHAQRDSHHFWPDCKGKVATINAAGLMAVEKILDNNVWWNVHVVPTSRRDGERLESIVLEIRHPEGYGLRYGLEPLTFRGFLETPMEDGHQNGWKH